MTVGAVAIIVLKKNLMYNANCASPKSKVGFVGE
jgi:hypothetical protein